MKCFLIQTHTGDFVSANGGVTEFASEGLAFQSRDEAMRCSFRFIASRVVEVSIQIQSYESVDPRQTDSFVTNSDQIDEEFAALFRGRNL